MADKQEKTERVYVTNEQVERLKAGERLRTDAPTADGKSSFELTVLPVRSRLTGRVVKMVVSRRE